MLEALIPMAAGGAATGAGFKDWVLIIAGNLFIIVLVVRAVGYYAKREWGEMVVHLIGGIIVAGLVYATDDSIWLLKELWKLITGS